jgi:glycosyltransferase involved in cell wall biosynthesis
LKQETARPEGGQWVATIALIDWSHLIEDYLDHLNVSFETFRDEFVGSWMFGYIAALRTAGVKTVLFLVSARVAEPWRFTHRPTGAPVCILPAPTIYRAIRRRVLNPYALTVEQAVGSARGIRYAGSAIIKEVAPYFATPAWRLARELRREGCIALLCQEYEHARFDICVTLGGLMGLPVFATFQGGDTQLSRLECPLRQLTLRACAGVIIAARTEAERVRARYRVPPAKLAQIFNPVDMATWHGTDRGEARAKLGIPEDARVAAWHGRVLVCRKGLDVLLDAWERVCAERPGRDLRLLLLGTGNDADEFRRRLAVKPLAGVTWVDRFVQDRTVLRTYLAAADLYVLPSRHEGFPVAPIEAMSCGLPVVATDAPGISDILGDGEASGGMVTARGNAAALSAALGRLLEDQALSRELGKRAQRRAQVRFSLETVGSELSKFLLPGFKDRLATRSGCTHSGRGNIPNSRTEGGSG